MKRVQQRRGVKLPPGSKSVARPSRWGNRWRVERTAARLWSVVTGRRPDLTYRGTFDSEADARDWATRFYRYEVGSPPPPAAWLDPLRGFDLACYCDPADGMPCHADVLLELLATAAGEGSE